MGSSNPPLESPKGGDPSFSVFFSIFIAALVISQFLAAKLVAVQFPVLGMLVFPGGVLAYAVTYLCTDVISEVWGKARANRVVFNGFIANLVVIALVWLATLAPAKPDWPLNDAFAGVAGMILRVTGASVVAYLVSQYHDVWMYHLLRRLTHERHIWIRNNLSTMLSQFIDTVLFISLAFWGKMELRALGSLIIGQYVVKVALALADTPFIYGSVWLVRRRLRQR